MHVANICKIRRKTCMKNVFEKSHWRKPLAHILEKTMNTVIGELKCNDANFVQTIDYYVMESYSSFRDRGVTVIKATNSLAK